MPASDAAQWRLWLPTPAERVFNYLSTDTGREPCWCERRTVGQDIHLQFPSGETLQCRVLCCEPSRRFCLHCFNQSHLCFTVTAAPDGTERLLAETGLIPADRALNEASRISALLALKAALLGIDVRNYDPQRSLAKG